MKTIFNLKKSNQDGGYWLTISDLMSGLMIVFLFISISFMRYTQIEKDKVAIERDKIKNIAVAYQENQVEIYNALNNEFIDDLPKWNASIDKHTLSFQFNAPEVLFGVGKSNINVIFQNILNDFIPRYLDVLSNYKNSIDEIRIEGHTSSEWRYKTSEDKAYFYNMQLSQERTRSVLEYAYHIKNINDEKRQWIKEKFAAVGFSSSKIIKDIDGYEDKKHSRRVTFRVITNADIQIKKIIESM